MCNISARLMAWLDDELPEDEAADMEQHIRGCMECRSRVKGYEEAGKLFDAYCDAMVASRVGHPLPRWTPVVAGGAAIAAAAALLLVFVPAPVDHLPLYSQAAAPAPALVRTAGLSPVKRSERRSAVKRERRPVRSPVPESVHSEGANWRASGPAIQITIPGDAMFPPGAVPEGVDFVADLSVAADGSPEGIRLRP